MFIDEITIHVKAGDGGDGSVHFRREKYVPRGGPDGGDGGKGGGVILKASFGVRTLMHLRFCALFKAENGVAGKGSKKTGKDGADYFIEVPVGTLVKQGERGQLIGDLKKEGDTLIVARGGRRGRGNACFATSTNQAPRYAEKGTDGEEKFIHLELKLLADVGLIGLPNAGKSTLISRISAAKPKIADYPFTTLYPYLGIVAMEGDKSFSVADIPGLIQGAHQGIGLGDKFLKHIERSRLLVHLIDVSSSTTIDPVEAYHTITEEMRLFNPALVEKKQVIVASKIDHSDKDKLHLLESFCQSQGFPFLAISAVTGENIPLLIHTIYHLLTTLEREEYDSTITKA